MKSQFVAVKVLVLAICWFAMSGKFCDSNSESDSGEDTIMYDVESSVCDQTISDLIFDPDAK